MAQHSDHALDDVWYSTEPSYAHRMPKSFRSRGSNQGILVTNAPQPRQIFYESSGELGFFHYALARGDVVGIREQQEAIYRDDEGTVRRHYFDAILTMRSTTRIAVAYKPHDRAEALHFKGHLSNLAMRISPAIADQIVLITERDLPRTVLHNSALLHDCRRDPPGDADAAVLAVLANITGQISVANLQDATAYEGEAFRAIVRLIGCGRILVQDEGRISRRTLVRAAGPKGTR